ncbi:MAG: rhomboid family intramembrane serine protease [Chloroflexales bacterium]|nr:rhomboid family intramembrane serine protease [Chloroflexales bacterium]
MFPLGDENPTKRVAVVNWALIALNLMAFALELLFGERFIVQWSFIPARFSALLSGSGDPQALATVFTAMFLHAGWSHIIGNMLFLWIFGDNVEDRFGSVPYLIFYLLCGLGATAAQYATDRTSLAVNLGASGAISGVMGAYVIMFPRALVRFFVWPFSLFLGIFRIPAVLMLGVWFILQLLPAFQSLRSMGDEAGGVAYWAHVGGFVVGLVLVFFFRPRREPGLPNYGGYRR